MEYDSKQFHCYILPQRERNCRTDSGTEIMDLSVAKSREAGAWNAGKIASIACFLTASVILGVALARQYHVGAAFAGLIQ